jgi:hypothetical protein
MPMHTTETRNVPSGFAGKNLAQAIQKRRPAQTRSLLRKQALNEKMLAAPPTKRAPRRHSLQLAETAVRTIRTNPLWRVSPNVCHKFLS